MVYWSRVVSAEIDIVCWLNYVVQNINYILHSFVRSNSTKMDKAISFFPLHVLPTVDAILFIEKISLPCLTKPMMLGSIIIYI